MSILKQMNIDNKKVAFETKEYADAEILRIIETDFNVCKSKKPCRSYLSGVTGKWHITSKPTIKVY